MGIYDGVGRAITTQILAPPVQAAKECRKLSNPGLMRAQHINVAVIGEHFTCHNAYEVMKPTSL